MARHPIKVEEEGAGERLDRFLAQRWADRSRSYWQRQIERGQVRVNGRAEKAGYILKAGQVVEADLEDAEEPTLVAPQGEPRALPPWVCYMDAAIVVIDKPRHLVVHPSAGHWHDSVVHQLLPWLPYEAGEWRPGVVHRLDKDTSGLMVLARSRVARERLSAAIQARAVTRQYVAVVRGHFHPPDGLIEAPLGRDPVHRLKMAVVYGGREARTHYRTLARWAGASLVECTLDTGRTHQIRVHAASLGHPVIGDPLYGGRLEGFMEGQLLHAGRLAFHHPITGEPMAFVAPPPEDWRGLSALGRAEVLASWVYQPGVDPGTTQWLSELGIDACERNS